MRLHLPHTLRAALLAVLSSFTLAAAGYELNGVGVEKRYWIDAGGNKHELEREYDLSGTLGVSNAKEFVIKDCTLLFPYTFYDAAGVRAWFESVETIHAETVNIADNMIVVSDGGSQYAGAMMLDLACDDGVRPYAIGAGNRNKVFSFAFSGCKEVNITGNGAVGMEEDYGQWDEYEEEWEIGLGSVGAIRCVGEVVCDRDDYVSERLSVVEFKDNDKVYIRGNYSIKKLVDYDSYIEDHWHVLPDYMEPEDLYNNNWYYTNKECYNLFAILARDADVAFAAKEGQSVECYDSIWVDGTLWINTTAPKLRKAGESYTGTVLFSGEHTVEDLTAIKGSAPTDYEVLCSRTVYAENVYVEEGTLIIDKMYFAIGWDLDYSKVEHDFMFYSTPKAEVQLKDARITVGWYADETWYEKEGGDEDEDSPDQYATVYLPKATFTGCNTITANYILVENGTWTFNVGAENMVDPVVHIVFNDEHYCDELIPITKRGFETLGTTFRINVAGGLGKGQYKLLEFDSSLGEWVGRDAVTLAGSVSGSIAKDSGKVYYTIDDADILTLWYSYGGAPGSTPSTPEQPKPSEGPITWVAGSGIWATGAAGAQWSGSAGSVGYQNGDSVVFAGEGVVTVAEVVRPADVLVSLESGTLELRSAQGGQITGDTKLTKTGAGELALNLANAYTGGTVIEGGRLTVGDDHALGLGAVELKGSELDMAGYAVGNDMRVEGAATIFGGSAYAGNLTLSEASLSGEIAICSRASLTAGNALLMGSLTLASGAVARVDGTLTLAAGGMLATGGEQTIRGGELELAGGRLKLANTLTVDALSTAAETEVLLDMETLREKKGEKMIVIRATDLSRADESLLNFSQLKNARSESGKSDSGIWVKLNSASLTWQPGGTGSWGLQEEGGEWETDAENRHFYDMDDVTFKNSDEVNIVGEVMPGSITVMGAGDTSFVGSGSIVGVGKLVKSGDGTLTMATDNSAYSGDIEINGGRLLVGHEHALGSAAVSISNAGFNGGGYSIANKVSFSGNSNIVNADGASDIVFEDRARVSGSYTLAMGNHLTAGKGASFCEGSITFAGGVLHLEGAFAIDAEARFEPNHTARSVAGSLTTIDLSDWAEGGLRYGSSYRLIQLEGEADTASYFTIAGLSEAMMRRASLEYGEGWLTLMIERLGMDEGIASTLNSNQLAVYAALDEIVKAGEEEGLLAAMADEVFGTDDPAAVRQLLDKLSGAELATAMTSQVEGNMAHLRRLRGNIGRGQRLDGAGKNAAYIAGYDAQTNVSADAGMPGMKRSEWGGMVGYERSVDEKSVFGIALNNGNARVTPTHGERYDESAVRVDCYYVANFGRAWQSVTSIGYGIHSFDMTRHLPQGHTSNASMDGSSINFQQEISYTIRTSETNSWQPFALLEISANSIDAFAESGAGTASLEGGSRSATAADLTLGTRYIHSFRASGYMGNVSVQAGVALGLGERSADIDMNFAGAPNRRFCVSAAEAGSMGFNLGASVLYPLTKHTAVTASADAELRSGATSWNVGAGVRVGF